MKKTKRFMAAALATTLSAAMLAGCGGGSTSDSSSGSASSGSTGSSDTAAASESSLTYNGQDVSEPVELVMYYIGDKPEDEPKVLEQNNALLKEKINATLTLKNVHE